MTDSRRKIVVTVMIPVIVALILLRQTLARPTLAGARSVDVFSLLVTGALLGIAFGATIQALRKK